MAFDKDGYVEKYKDAILGKLAAHGLTIDNDWCDIYGVLSETCGPELCLNVAHFLKFGKFIKK